MSNDMDERYATAREHWELREDVAGLKADVRQIGPSLARIETMIAAKSSQAPQQDNVILAVHDLAKSVRESVDGRTGNTNPILITLAIIGACAIGAGAMYLLGHH